MLIVRKIDREPRVVPDEKKRRENEKGRFRRDDEPLLATKKPTTVATTRRRDDAMTQLCTTTTHALAYYRKICYELARLGGRIHHRAQLYIMLYTCGMPVHELG